MYQRKFDVLWFFNKERKRRGTSIFKEGYLVSFEIMILQNVMHLFKHLHSRSLIYLSTQTTYQQTNCQQ